MTAQTMYRFDNIATKGRLPSQIRPAPNFVFQKSLSANTAVLITVPVQQDAAINVVGSNTNTVTQAVAASYVLFSATANFWALPNALASTSDETTNGTASELNPAAWGLGSMDAAGLIPVTTIGLISNVTCTVTMSFYVQD